MWESEDEETSGSSGDDDVKSEESNGKARERLAVFTQENSQRASS